MRQPQLTNGNSSSRLLLHMLHRSLLRRALRSLSGALAFVVFAILIVSFPLLIRSDDGGLSFSVDTAARQIVRFFSSVFDGSILGYTAGKTRRDLGAVLPRFFLNSFLFVTPACMLSVTIAVFSSKRRVRASSGYWRQLPLVFGILPSFIVAVVLQFLAVQIYQRTGIRITRIAHLSFAQPALFLPIVTMTLVMSLYLSRTAGAAVARIRAEDYITFARSRGISERLIFYRHIVPGVLSEMRFGLHGMLGILFADLFILERVFKIPGLTQLIFANAISYEWSYQLSRYVWTYQYNLILTSVFCLGLLYLVMYWLTRLFLHGLREAFLRGEVG